VAQSGQRGCLLLFADELGVLGEGKMSEYIPPYEGDDIMSFVLKDRFNLYESGEQIKSITNVRDTAIVVTNYSVWRIRPMHQIGYCIEKIASI
jgi:hypothetical protein